ncbi:MAG: hypothetical protein VYE75_07165 [Actinomycetota bacterium]|nr:hypothetical protein [Actinomycetota bacterium]
MGKNQNTFFCGKYSVDDLIKSRQLSTAILQARVSVVFVVVERVIADLLLGGDGGKH